MIRAEIGKKKIGRAGPGPKFCVSFLARPGYGRLLARDNEILISLSGRAGHGPKHLFLIGPGTKFVLLLRRLKYNK